VVQGVLVVVSKLVLRGTQTFRRILAGFDGERATLHLISMAMQIETNASAT
jgi:hypothetical protein